MLYFITGSNMIVSFDFNHNTKILQFFKKIRITFIPGSVFANKTIFFGNR